MICSVTPCEFDIFVDAFDCNNKGKQIDSGVSSQGQGRADLIEHILDQNRSQDYKEISSMDWGSTHNLCSEMT